MLFLFYTQSRLAQQTGRYQVRRFEKKTFTSVKILFLFIIQVVLASIPDMECGFSRDLFTQWCSNSKNTIILTNRTSPGTLARQLIDNPNEKSVHLQVSILTISVVTLRLPLGAKPCYICLFIFLLCF